MGQETARPTTRIRSVSAILVFLFQVTSTAFAQQIKFAKVVDANLSSRGGITSMAQDRQGYIWMTVTLSKGKRGGLYRYDGSSFLPFLHDSTNANSISNNWTECLTIDSANNVWIGTYGSGLDKYDQGSNKFTHYKHDKAVATSLINDSITALFKDSKGILWVGTLGGLDKLDEKTGTFTHYTHNARNNASISSNDVRVIYEDKQGVLWVGCGSPFAVREPLDEGGLNRFNSSSGTFTRYLHNASDSGSLANNKIRALLEDSKGNFWVGTAGDGLHIMDRRKGVFTHYYYDAAHPGKLSPPLPFQDRFDCLSFIKEDKDGAIWIGSFLNGINRYNPSSKELTHYGPLLQPTRFIQDTVSGLNENELWTAFVSRDGLLWTSTLNGSLYSVNPFSARLPYFTLGANANSFYKEPGKNVLWTGTEKGLWRKDLTTGETKVWRHDEHNGNSLCNDTINAMRVDADGAFWIATNNGLSKFNPATNAFTTYRNNKADSNSLRYNTLNNIFIDDDKNIWIATAGPDIDKLDIKKNAFAHFATNDRVSLCFAEDKSHNIWTGTFFGLSKRNKNGTQLKEYLKGFKIRAVFIDSKGVVWAGGDYDLYSYDVAADDFKRYTDQASQATINGVLHMMEDDQHNLWVATLTAIVKINEKRDAFESYGESYGVHESSFLFADNFKSDDGRLFFGDQAGYYAFHPNSLNGNNTPPLLSLSSFKLEDKEVVPGAGSVLPLPLWQAKEIKLAYNQNVFSFDFMAIRYIPPVEIKYLFKLENYDKDWHNIGANRTAYFFNVPPGKYVFHVKAVNSDGTSAEKTIDVIITPPWWQTWWAYALYAVGFIGLLFFSNRMIRARIIEKERAKNREKELAQAKEIEKAYTELKATQAQLIHSEKMASLGELTAGIAHEIQNPLNFVNNFSEVNNELIDEMTNENDASEIKSIAQEIRQNNEKIAFHGKRADAIVKAMLQHSRQTTGIKEPTDLNALCDEYLRLSYHGLRARDKAFNAGFKTGFDESIGKVSLVQQDIGRVLLNLFNNAFYAVTDKQRLSGKDYHPTVTVLTKRLNDKIEIRVEDNGAGIPQAIIDKIFQPFFTTKPTGQGTGLGLSLAYDIIAKEHGGTIKVESKEGEYSRFIIQLPTE